MKFAAFVMCAVMAVPGLVLAAPGYVRLEDHSRAERPISLSVWYPAQAEATEDVGGNAVFVGTPAAMGAELPAGPRPLVILSHGGLRSADDSGAWLAAEVAETGAVVVEVSAPRIETGAEAAAEIAARPGDMSLAVDVMRDHADWAERIDTDRIAVVGFALGGTAALAVAGAEVDAAAIAGACAPGGMGSPDCDWLAGQGSTLEEFALAEARDERFGAAVAIAPEYAGALDGADVPVRVVTLDDGMTLFDEFPVCTARAPEILGEGAVICGASEEARRAAHERILDAVSGFMAEIWD